MNTPTNDFTLNGKTYQLRYRKCSSSRECKCHEPDNPGHGPYWYTSGDYGGLKYVGKELPADVLRVLELIETEKAELLEIQTEAHRKRRAASQEERKYSEQVRAIEALMFGNQADSRVLQELGLDRFIVK